MYHRVLLVNLGSNGETFRVFFSLHKLPQQIHHIKQQQAIVPTKKPIPAASPVIISLETSGISAVVVVTGIPELVTIGVVVETIIVLVFCILVVMEMGIAVQCISLNFRIIIAEIDIK